MITRSRSLKSTDKAKSIFYGIKGYNASMGKIYKSILAYSISDEAKFRHQVIEHFHQFGLDSTMQAFKVSRASIYRWQKQFIDSQGQLKSLVSKSRAPKRRRSMTTDIRILEFIKSLRLAHYRVGKDKIKPLLDQYCRALGIKSISSSTIAKVISRNQFYFQKKNHRIYHNPNSKFAQNKVKYKTKIKRSPIVNDSGYLEIDTVALFVNGVKRYIYHAIDLQSRFAFAYTYHQLNSHNTVNFFDKLKQIYPLSSGIKTIQTDNGLEFLGEFEKRLAIEVIPHLFIYPRCPKINGFIERANRSLREEFIESHLDMVDNLFEFNHQLMEHLIWYNTVRPHQALKFMTPIDYLLKRYPESQMYATRTIA